MLSLRAPAKLNLGLRVLAPRRDGYHEIETIFVPLRLFDRLEITALPSADPVLEVLGDGVEELPRDSRNLALRAARETCRALGAPPGLRIRLDKHIPLAAGLGGGSSDAALTILGVEKLVGRRLEAGARLGLARSLGADVPFFLDPRPALGRGVGERLEPIPGVPEMWWVLLVLPFPVSTAKAYRLASAELTPLRRDPSIASLLGAAGLACSPPNDLESVVARRHPAIVEARRALDRAGAMVTGMSGSGPTVYGRFPDREAAGAAASRVEGPKGARTIVVSSPGSDSRDWGWGVAKR